MALASRKSTSLRRRYATNPLVNPNTSVIRPTPIATSGGKPKPNNKIGAKKIAPPTPDDIAMVAMTIEIGNMNQLSNDILKWPVAGRVGCKFGYVDINKTVFL